MRTGVSEGVITPPYPTLLAGYPLPKDRYHLGVHDDLYVRCYYLANHGVELGLVMVDNGELSKARTLQIRKAIQACCGIPWQNISISCSHTHSAPVGTTVPFYWWNDDREMYPYYLDFLAGMITDKMEEAKQNAFEAEFALGRGHCGAKQGVGGNRRDKNGPADPDVYTCAIYERGTDTLRGVWVNYALHPTFLHAESREITADYPGYIYNYFRQRYPGVVAGFTLGAAGNQSSRHFRTGQTFAEAQRVGEAIAAEAQRTILHSTRQSDPTLFAASRAFTPPEFEIPTLQDAETGQAQAQQAYSMAQAENRPYPELRTLECTLIGANHLLDIAKAGDTAKRLIAANSPFEIQVMGIGDARIAYYSCEIFVEYALRLKAESPFEHTMLASCTNGGASGYVCTPQAHAEGGYEALWTRYRPETGDLMVDETLRILEQMKKT